MTLKTGSIGCLSWSKAHLLIIALSALLRSFTINATVISNTNEKFDIRTGQIRATEYQFMLENEGEEIPQSITQLWSLYKTARYGGQCDIDLYNKFIKPIYNTRDIDEAFNAKVLLDRYLSKNPGKEKSSCYGLVSEEDPREQFMVCEEACEHVATHGQKFNCCKCMHEEPYIYEKKPYQPCQLVESELGDPCDYEFSQSIAKRSRDAFLKSLVNAKTRYDYVQAIFNYGDEMTNHLEIPNIKRLICQNESNNLECKKDGKCGCVDQAPYLKYVPHENNRNCVGKKNAICHLVMATSEENVFLDKISECAAGLTCQEAVPDLYCSNMDDEDCLYERTVEMGKDNVTDPFTLWNIRACGGKWKDKPALSNESFRSSVNYIQEISLLLLGLSFYRHTT